MTRPEPPSDALAGLLQLQRGIITSRSNPPAHGGCAAALQRSSGEVAFALEPCRRQDAARRAAREWGERPRLRARTLRRRVE